MIAPKNDLPIGKELFKPAREQCDRTVLAKIEPIVTFDEYLKTSRESTKPALKLLLSPDATKNMYSVLIKNDPQDIVLMIGSERWPLT